MEPLPSTAEAELIGVIGVGGGAVERWSSVEVMAETTGATVMVDGGCIGGVVVVPSATSWYVMTTDSPTAR